MSTQRHPVLIWSDASGAHTAALVGDSEAAAASADSAAEALRQLKNLLEWRRQHESWWSEPEITDPALVEVKVEIRPQYTADERVLACRDTVWLRVPLGEWEERCEEIIHHLNALGGVFCAENLLELVQAGGQGPGSSVGAFLLPYLQRGELRLIAEATPAEVEACRRLLPGLLDVFQVVPVPALTDEEAVRVLDRVARTFAASSRMEIESGVPVLVHRLFARFQPYAVFPGPAARFLRRVCERTGTGAGTVTSQDVMTAFLQQTGLPEVFLRDDLPLSWKSLGEHFARQIIGQPAATSAAARVVTRIKAGLADPGRPFGVLLFCGPTGVGKTALAKALAGYCFGASGGGDRLVRLDMSEFAGWGAAERLLQTPPGRPAPWIERVRQQPFCVVLLDEIEKAAPEVFDVLLGLLDEGRLTDRFGRITQFRSAILILTSNLGAAAPAEAGFATRSSPVYEAEVAKFFRPEFFNRLDAVVTFNALTPSDVEAITRKELAELGEREGFVAAGLKLVWSERLVRAVACEGYDQRFGARPLQRAIERRVAMPVARWILDHPQVKHTTLELDWTGSEVTVVTAH